MTEITPDAAARVKSYIDRVERLEAEKQTLAEDIKEVYAEAKGAGFNAAILRKLIRLRRTDTQKRIEEAELLKLYAAASGTQLELGI